MDTLIEKVSEYVHHLFKEHTRPELTYHNLSHTLRVVSRAKQISECYQLSEDDNRIMEVAAWFHDVAFLTSGIIEHEKRSVTIMHDFLVTLNIDQNVIKRIADCILSTRQPPAPTNLLEDILCDADTYHLGTEEFLKSDVAVKKELELCSGKTFDDWDKKTLSFLLNHQYFTGYCQKLLTSGKEANIKLLSQKINNR